MSSPFTRLGAALVLAGTLVVATACAAPAPEPTASETAAPSPSAPSPEPTTAETEAPEADPTCETIIPDSTVADFESVGWTVQADKFYIGEFEIPDGLTCRWADFDAPAGDHLQFYGWAPILDEVAAEAQDSLVGQGWIREEAPEGVYLTENPETTIAVDEDGYGMTYLFTDGAVSLADTKQGLILVEWPRS
ncbi:MAG: hypothetical protein ABW024_09555 [Microbacterium sp.]